MGRPFQAAVHPAHSRSSRSFDGSLLAFTLFAGATAFLTGCGLRGAPLPPIRAGQVRTATLSAVQQGGQIHLRWIPPTTTRANAARYVRIDVYRLAERRGESPKIEAADFLDEANVVGFIDLRNTTPPLAAKFTDPIDFSSASIGDARFRYAIAYIRDDDSSGGLSNYASIEPEAAVAGPPPHLTARLTQDAILLDWQAPAANVDGSALSGLIGYNVYRQTGGSEGDRKPRNETPISAPSFAERKFEFTKTYTFSVRAVSQARGRTIESADSEALTITPVDTFPPSAPVSVTIASVSGTVSLFWPSNPEEDVAGYNVYRSEDPNLDPKRWLRVNAALVPHPPTSFRDSKVETGKRYYYQVTAVDRFQNESPRSEVISEIVNP